MNENNEYTDNGYENMYGSSNSTSNSSADSAGNGNSYTYGDSIYGTSSGYTSSGSSSGGAGSSGGNGREKKKHSGLLKKAAALALSAVLFGGIAGSAMVGVQYAAQKAGIVSEKSGNASIKVAESVTGTSKGNGTLPDVSAVVEQVLPSVVSITNTQIYESYRNQFSGWPFFFGYEYDYGGSAQEGEKQEIEAGSGSGIIIGQNDSELLIVTNYHVIEGADSLTIRFADESTAKAAVKGTDADNDLAVVSVTLSDLNEETQSKISIATMDTSDNCKVGQGVIAIGNALGYGQSITVGYISALDRAVATSDGSSRNLLQTDAAINPGNSGGALVNEKGEVIGINSAKYSSTDVEGMGFAIPISKVYDIIDNLMNQKTKIEVAEEQRGYLGIKVKTVSDTDAQSYNMPKGVYVYEIMENGAASKSDLKARDIITKLNGSSVLTQDALTEGLKYYAVGETVTLTVSRLENGEYVSYDIEVVLAKQVNQ